jgi:hypothetical protein
VGPSYSIIAFALWAIWHNGSSFCLAYHSARGPVASLSIRVSRWRGRTIHDSSCEKAILCLGKSSSLKILARRLRRCKLQLNSNVCRVVHRHKTQRRVTFRLAGDLPMTFQTAPFFPHRRNKDGSFDSICLKCFATVASHIAQEELQELDKNHVCTNSLLSRRGDHVSLTQDDIKNSGRR